MTIPMDGLKPMIAASAVCVAAMASCGATKASAETVNPFEHPDDSHLSLSGVIDGLDSNKFVLDYGRGSIIVELKGWNKETGELGFRNGARVIVFGELDKDVFATSTIEASSIFYRESWSYFYAEDSLGIDSPKSLFFWADEEPNRVSDMLLRGEVVATNPEEQRFTIAVSDTTEVTVTTSALPYDPLASGDRDPVDEGDWVRVDGRLDFNFFDRKTIHADSISTLYEDPDDRADSSS